MPAVTKASTPKKPGAPKVKGQARNKTGCYTCRIRRKKCDERRDANDRCETCVRLKLECLGFGAKRPEWLRDSSKLQEIRDTIKSFLASHGMIKGHAGSGARAGNEEAILRLSDPSYLPHHRDYMSSSESPPSHTLSLSAENDYRTHNTSAMREEWLSPGFDGISHPDDVRGHSPYGGSHHGTPFNDVVPLAYQGPTSTSLVSSSSLIPLYSSSFSPLYYFQCGDPEEFDYDGSPRSLYGDYPVPMEELDELIKHYMEWVIDLQYMFADQSALSKIIHKSVRQDGFSRHAARLLAAIHYQRLSDPGVPALESGDTKQKYEHLRSILNPNVYTEDEAMAALHTVSSVLFDGGRGDWTMWLAVAQNYVYRLFRQGRGARATLTSHSEGVQFIIKTTIWFDVLASLSTLQPPIFLPVIEELWSPKASGIAPDPMSAAMLSMVSVMGCENHVVWALAKISDLACWKHAQLAKGTLSMPLLVEKGNDIEEYIRDPNGSAFMSNCSIEHSRRLACEVFRTAAKVYLHSVVSGDHPRVPETRQSVDETMESLHKLWTDDLVPENQRTKVVSRVVRSTVFALYMCGCLTNNEEHRSFIRAQLAKETGAGNCSTVRQMLDEMWATSPPSSTSPVPWRQKLHEKMLLLV